MIKPIDCQDTKKLEKVKPTLDKQFEYTSPSLNYEHIQTIVGKILKTKQREWMLHHQVGMG
jgi:hypothetical protein